MLRSEPISLLSGSCTELQANVQARVYFQLKRRRRRRRRESSLQGGEQRSRWLRGESTFLWKQLPVSSHSLLSKKPPKCCSPTATNRRMWAFFLFFKTHSDYIQSARPTSVPVPIQINGSETKRCRYIPEPGKPHPPGPLIQSRSGRGGTLRLSVKVPPPPSLIQKDVLLHSL